MPNGPPNPWSESNSPSLRQNQGGSAVRVERADNTRLQRRSAPRSLAAHGAS